MRMANRSMMTVALLAATMSAAHAEQVTCESRDQRRVECPMNTQGEVRLERQLSKAPCTDGVTWGLSKHAVWVDRGCRAVFANAGSPPPAGGGGHGGLPRLNATCGDGLEVHVDEGGPVYIDGNQATLKRLNDDYFEARHGTDTISLNRNPDGSWGMAWTGAGGDNGICNLR